MDNGDDYVIGIKQTTQLRDSQVAAATVTVAAEAGGPGEVAEISTTVDPHDSHDSVTSSHVAHDDAPASHHDESTTDDHAAVDDATAESTTADEPAYVEAAAETHDAAAVAGTDQQG